MVEVSQQPVYTIDDVEIGTSYFFVLRTPLYSREITLVHKNDGTWCGDVIEAGEWRDLSPEEIEDLKRKLKDNGYL